MARYSKNDPDLPDDIDEEPRTSLSDSNTLVALGRMLARKRDEAVRARSASGIEDVWTKCEESYIGIDDANRGDFAKAKWSKPTTMQGPVTTNYSAVDKQDVKSTAFVRLTSRYVDAGTAKIADILLSMDDKSFSIKPMPAPELTDLIGNNSPVLDQNGQTVMRVMTDDEVIAASPAAAPAGTPGYTTTPAPAQAVAPTAPGQPPAPPAQTQMTVGDAAQKTLDDMADSADKAETRIYNWLVKSGYPKEARMMLHDAARIGVGVLKGPIPSIDKAIAVLKTGDKVAVEIKKQLVPGMTWIDPWNLYPDESCSEDIHAGSGIRERSFMTSRQLEDLKELPGYLPDQIDAVIKEGPNKIYSEGANPAHQSGKETFEVWYCYDTFTRDEIIASNAVGAADIPKDQQIVFAVGTLVNDTLIKADINPLEKTGAFPYLAMPWSRRAGAWAGVGIAEQIEMPQRMANAGTRALMNNAGMASGVQILIAKGIITPADGRYNLYPNKIWYSSDDTIDVSKAMSTIEFPDLGNPLMSVIEYAFRLAEEASNIPLITQGINGQNTPDTFGAANIQNENSMTLLRSIGKIYDDHINDPMIKRLYEWLLLDPLVPNDEKMQFEIHAHGSSTIVERVGQITTLAQMATLVENPAFGIDPRKWFAEFMRSKRIDPRKVQFSEAEAKANAQNTAPPLQVSVAQINAKSKTDSVAAQVQGQMQIAQQQMQHEQAALQAGQATPHGAMASAKITEAQIRAQSNQAIESSRAQAELAYAENERQMSRENAIAQQQEMQDKRDMLVLQYSLQHNITLEQVRADLAKTAMVENTKKELASAEMQMEANQQSEDRNHDMTKHLMTTLSANKREDIASNE